MLVTLVGWFGLVLGLFRMFAASQYQRSAANTGAGVFMVLEALLFLVGLTLIVKAYTGEVDRR